jgi:hypothetical protein
LGRPILAFEVDSKTFDELLKQLLDAKLGKNILRPILTLDDDLEESQN